MSTASRRVVYSLMVVVVVLLVGIAGLLGVSYQRHQRLEDAAIDLQRNISQQEGQIKALQQKLENCDTVQVIAPADSGWGAVDQRESLQTVSQLTPAGSAIDRTVVAR